MAAPVTPPQLPQLAGPSTQTASAGLAGARPESASARAGGSPGSAATAPPSSASAMLPLRTTPLAPLGRLTPPRSLETAAISEAARNAFTGQLLAASQVRRGSVGVVSVRSSAEADARSGSGAGVSQSPTASGPSATAPVASRASFSGLRFSTLPSPSNALSPSPRVLRSLTAPAVPAGSVSSPTVTAVSASVEPAASIVRASSQPLPVGSARAEDSGPEERPDYRTLMAAHQQAVKERAHMEAALLSALQSLRAREKELIDLRTSSAAVARADASAVSAAQRSAEAALVHERESLQRAAVTAVEQERRQAEAAQQQLQQRLQHAVKQQEALDEALHAERAARQAAEQRVSDLQRHADGLTAEVATLRRQLDNATQAAEHARALAAATGDVQSSELRSELLAERMRARTAEHAARQAADDARREVAALTASNDRLANALSLADVKRTELETALAAVQQRLRLAEQDAAASAQALLERVQAQAALSEQRADEMWRARYAAEADATEARANLDTAQRELQDLRARLVDAERIADAMRPEGLAKQDQLRKELKQLKSQLQEERSRRERASAALIEALEVARARDALRTFLTGMRMEKYFAAFETHGIRLQDLLTIKNRDLAAAGIGSELERATIMEGVRRFRRNVRQQAGADGAAVATTDDSSDG